MEYTKTEDFAPASPSVEPTFEEKAEHTGKLLNSALDSYETMSVAAALEDAPEEGKAAALTVQEKYKDRLEELLGTDLGACSEDELDALSLELSRIITAIREARDLLCPPGADL